MGFTFWFLILFSVFLVIVFIGVAYTIVRRDRELLQGRKRQQELR